MRSETKLLLLVNSFFVFALNLFAPFYALFIQKIDPSILHVGAVWSVYIFSVGIFALLVSRYSKLMEHAGLFLIFGFLFRASGWLGYMFASSIWHIYLIQVLLAIGEALGTPAYNLLYSGFIDKRKFGSEWGVNTSVFAFATGIASLSGAVILDMLGFNALFLVMIALSFLSTALALKNKRIFWKTTV